MVNLDVLEGGWKGSPLWWAWVEIFRCVHHDAVKVVAYILTCKNHNLKGLAEKPYGCDGNTYDIINGLKVSQNNSIVSTYTIEFICSWSKTIFCHHVLHTNN